ncbi:sugar phosphate isomerase/epimerase [Streptomyces sp. NBS 14/10]|uniref:sugar phosphate isomerase/epimerase family protein n=1 Tax=Streptomyces sp. NBS 14/10 TaxID=1945643 RepID=UPI000B7FDBAB|nr:sugar phosphate isomerase/epimerase [Streptomyces sp. NBS 14/10]KAK1184389.1 sugar phosphate isomerase/epimerase [Streptomyces sp. NBS 14/10]
MTTPQLFVQTGIYGYGIFGRAAEEDLEGTLDMVKAAGYDGVEVMTSLTGDPRRLSEACARRGLSISAFHVFWHELADGRQWDTAEALGTSRVILSGIPSENEEAARASIAPLRAFAAEAAARNMRLLVHNHAEECRPLPSNRTVLEILVEHTTCEELGYVIDLHWAAVGGDVARTIRTTADRCDYYHIKDGSITDPEEPHSYDLGSGEVDLNGAWKEIRSTGTVATVVVERGMPANDLPAALHHDARFVRQLLSDSAENPR